MSPQSLHHCWRTVRRKRTTLRLPPKSSPASRHEEGHATAMAVQMDRHAAKVLLAPQRLYKTPVSGEETKKENAMRRNVSNKPTSGLFHRLNRTSKRSHSHLLHSQVTLTHSLVSVVRCSLTPMK